MNRAEEFEDAKVLAALRWGDAWRCTVCQGAERYHLESRPRVMECAECGQQHSVTAGTALHGTRLALRVWFRAVEMFSTLGGIAARALARELGINRKSAARLVYCLQEAIVAEPELISGLAKLAYRSVSCRDRGVRVTAVVAVDESGRAAVQTAPSIPQAEEALQARFPEATLESAEQPSLPAMALSLRIGRTHRGVGEARSSGYAAAGVFVAGRIAASPQGGLSNELAKAGVWARCLRARTPRLSPPLPLDRRRALRGRCR